MKIIIMVIVQHYNKHEHERADNKNKQHTLCKQSQSTPFYSKITEYEIWPIKKIL